MHVYYFPETVQMNLHIATTPLTTEITSHSAKGNVVVEFAFFHLTWYRWKICTALKVGASWILCHTEIRSNHNPSSTSYSLIVILVSYVWIIRWCSLWLHWEHNFENTLICIFCSRNYWFWTLFWIESGRNETEVIGLARHKWEQFSYWEIIICFL